MARVKTKQIPLILVIAVVVILIILAFILGARKEKAPEGPAIAEEIYGFSGEIKEIKDKTLMIEALIPLADEKEEPIKEIVKAVVIDQTKIVKLDYPEEIPENTEEAVHPEERKISFEELKTGDKVDFGTTNNVSENVKNKTEFIISYIFVFE